MDLLTEVLTALRAVGLVGDQREFSTGWLVRSPSYYSSMRTRSPTRTVSTQVMLNLYHRLRASMQGEATPDPAVEAVALRLWEAIMDRLPPATQEIQETA